MEITFEKAKETFARMYGDAIFNSKFSSFGEAFYSAWESVDFISNATTPEEFCEGMCECWQLQDVD